MTEKLVVQFNYSQYTGQSQLVELVVANEVEAGLLVQTLASAANRDKCAGLNGNGIQVKRVQVNG